MWYEDDHDRAPPYLERKKAETMASCPPPLPSRMGMGMTMANILLLSGVDGREDVMANFLPSVLIQEEDDHPPTPPFLKRREAETIAPFPPSV